MYHPHADGRVEKNASYTCLATGIGRVFLGRAKLVFSG